MGGETSARQAWRLRLIVRAVLVLIVAAAAIWLTLAMSLTTVLRKHNPEMALGWWSPDSDARVQAAYSLLQRDRSPAALARARRLAIGAVVREPVNAAGVRTVALLDAVAGNQARAQRIMAYAQSLSRRDVVAQIWLIEQEVQRNNIEGALRHYDRALRVSREPRALLIPILVQSSSDPAIARPLGALLERRPSWRFAFAEQLTAESRSAATMAYLIRRLGLNPADDRDRNFILRALRRMIELGDHRRAYALYRDSRGAGAPGPGQVRNGDFESGDPGFPPFDWHYVSEGGLGAFREAREGAPGTAALTLSASTGRNGEVARQLLILAPGRYRLSALAGDVGSDEMSRPQVAILCAVRGGQDLMRASLPAAESRPGRMQQGFTVPAGGCPAQWLSIVARSDLQTGASEPWIDSIAIARE